MAVMGPRARVSVAVAALLASAGLAVTFLRAAEGDVVPPGLPPELRYVPADAELVAGADAPAVLGSSLRQPVLSWWPATLPDAAALDSLVGIRFDRDVDRLLVVVEAGPGPPASRAVLFVRGRFDRNRVEAAFAAQGAFEEYESVRIGVRGTPAIGVALVEPDLLALGPLPALHVAIDVARGGHANVAGNAALVALVQDAADGDVWAAGRFEWLAASGRLPEQAIDQLPPIDWFAMSGRAVTPVSARLRVEARDTDGAATLRDAVRGFVAIAGLQAGRNAGVSALLSSVALSGEGRTLSVSFVLPPGLAASLGRAGATTVPGPAGRGTPAPPALPR